MDEQGIEIAAKLYQCRKSALFLLGAEKFKAKVEEWAPVIKGVMKAHGCDAIRATMVIVEKLQAKGHDGVLTMLVFAVCVEMLEPSAAEAVRG